MTVGTTYDLARQLNEVEAFLTENALRLWGVELPFWMIGVGIIAMLVVVFQFQREPPNALAYPYYVDEDGLRSIASSLKISLPLRREMARRKGIGLGPRALHLSQERNETVDTAGIIDLYQLALDIAKKAQYWTVTEIDLRSEGPEGALLDIAKSGSLLIVRGMFVASGSDESSASGPVAVQSTSGDLRVVLPDPSAVTKSGGERLRLADPFYGQIIAHSASYDLKRGWPVVALAYAVWGRTRR